MVDNEFSKIKKENNGQGVGIDESLLEFDQSMQMFRKELQRLLMVPQKNDQFIKMKVKKSN